MKLNIAYPALGTQKLFEFESDVRALYDRRIGQEIDGELISPDFAGYVLKITGLNDKQGFAAQPGVLLPGRVRLLLDKDSKNYRPRRTGERKRKSVHGAILGPDVAVVALVIVKQGDNDIPGLTDTTEPKRHGPKRANHIRQLFGLTKEDDVRKFVIRRPVTGKNGKEYTKAPKIQRLITPRRLQHKRRAQAQKLASVQKSKDEAAEYAKLLHQRVHEKKAEKAEIRKRRVSSLRA